MTGIYANDKKVREETSDECIDYEKEHQSFFQSDVSLPRYTTQLNKSGINICF